MPVLTPSGSIHFASVAQAATANDVIESLITKEEIKHELLGDLKDAGWRLQKVTNERPGRVWEDTELEALQDGAFLYHNIILPILKVS